MQRAATVTSVAFSPDGAFMAAGARDGAVTVWSTAEPPAVPARVAAGLASFPNLVNVVQFAADGSTLAAAGSDGTVRIWSDQRLDAAGRVPAIRGRSPVCNCCRATKTS